MTGTIGLLKCMCPCTRLCESIFRAQ